MKFSICFLYVICQIIYLTFSDGSRLWGGLNIGTHIAFIGYLCHTLEKTHTGNEKLMFQYLKWVSIANCFYIGVCVWKDTYWVLYHTDLFVYIFGIGFLVFLIHAALKEG